MKKIQLILLLLMISYDQLHAQVTGSSFEVLVVKYRFGPQSLAYFDSVNIKVTSFLAENAIAQDNNSSKVDEFKVKKALKHLFRKPDSSGKLVIDWEQKDVFLALRDFPKSDIRYQTAEAEWHKLIGIIREMRPNVEIGIYGIPFKGYDQSVISKHNPPNKYDDLLALVDFLAPSVYLQFSEDQVKPGRNLQYVRENLEEALVYGKKLNLPVYPFFWHRIHDYNKKYGYELIQPKVFAEYVKFISTYSYDGYKSSGIYWWEALSKKRNLSKVDGLNGWAKGLVTNYDSYDALMVKYATAVIDELRE